MEIGIFVFLIITVLWEFREMSKGVAKYFSPAEGGLGNLLDWVHIGVQIYAIALWLDLHSDLFVAFSPRYRYQVYKNLHATTGVFALNSTTDAYKMTRLDHHEDIEMIDRYKDTNFANLLAMLQNFRDVNDM